MQEFTKRVIDAILSIPEGSVATYGQIAKFAGNPKAARQVVRVLSSQTKKFNLPWHRIINSQGKIAIKDRLGAEEQRFKLISEGVEVSDDNKVDLKKFQW